MSKIYFNNEENSRMVKSIQRIGETGQYSSCEKKKKKNTEKKLLE